MFHLVRRMDDGEEIVFFADEGGSYIGRRSVQGNEGAEPMPYMRNSKWGGGVASRIQGVSRLERRK